MTDAFAAILKGSADELRTRHRQATAGAPSSAEGLLDNDGVVVDKPIKLAVSVAIKDGIASFDFSASDPQARGPVNLRPSMVEACVFYALIGSLGPNLHFNDGMRDVVRLKFAPRTVVNADPPAPVSNYQMVNLLLVDVILEALAKFIPTARHRPFRRIERAQHRLVAGRPGQSTMQYEITGSSYGGGAGHDGTTATATHLSNLHTTPIEILESEFPCRITASTSCRIPAAPASGAAASRCGGNTSCWKTRPSSAASTRRVSAEGPRRRPGRHPARFVVRLGTDEEFETPASARFELKAGERFLVQSAGGGGYGDPAKRDDAARARDVAEGYVTDKRQIETREAKAMSFSSWRGVVGMVNPTMRPGMTEEVCRLLPEGIGLIPLFLNIRRGTEDEFETMMPHYEKLIALLAEQNCDIIHPNGAPPFMVHGFEGEAKIVAGWEKKYKTRISSVAQNHVRALEAVKAKSFVGATYSRRS